jgi:peptidoglycan/xylan/chitin deacetylase (PgdA/CDA1 family)
MTELESALVDIIGKFPTYMRPPYFSTNDAVLQTLGDLGYHVIQADIDTQDWANDSPDAIQTSVELFNQGLDAGGSIVLAHDVHENTANTLVPAMIAAIQDQGLQGESP